MKKTIKKLQGRYLWFLLGFNRLFLKRKSYLYVTGWIESIKRGYPCDKDGSELPWMNYAAINILNERLNKNLSLFEFGSGYSTLFSAERVKSVISTENNKSWFDLMQGKAPENVSLLYREKDIDGGYCRAISEFDQEFDVVIVDGRDRVNCTRQALEKLSKAGVIILDDSERERYFTAIDYAKEKGFRALHLEGLKPTGFVIHRTTILYRSENCLKI